MAESQLLAEKRAALEQVLQEQVTAQEWEERFERGRPLLDGVQVGTFEVVQAWVREFPRNFNPSSESTKKFYDAVQDYLRVTAVSAFIYGSITFPISAESQYGRRREGWPDELQPIFNLSRHQSLRHIETGFKAAVGGTNFNVLWPNIVQVLLTEPDPGPGHIAAANELANDPMWDELAVLAQQPEPLMRKKCKAFCEAVDARIAQPDGFLEGHDLAFRRALCDYRDGPGRWQELEEVDDKLRRLWIGIAGLDQSTDRFATYEHHSANRMIADGYSIRGMENYSIEALRFQIQLIEDNGGVLPVPPERPKRVAKPRAKRKEKTNLTVTREMLTGANPLFIRTDFSSDAVWAEVRDAATATVPIDGGEGGGGYDAAPNVQVVDDPQFDGLSAEEVVTLPWPNEGPLYCFVVDNETITDPEHPILAVNLSAGEEETTTFRVIPQAMAMVEMNLSIANLTFDDYGQQGDGIERYSGVL